MRAIKGRLHGNVVYLDEPTEASEGEVLVLIPTNAEEARLGVLALAGVWSDMTDTEWDQLQETLAQGVQMGNTR
ncbi:MAG: hypothetical protein NZM28_08135 [Fimbriimonadales bacterium]|nr:hypothetical protein [Fimbriimonadales bacterium]